MNIQEIDWEVECVDWNYMIQGKDKCCAILKAEKNFGFNRKRKIF